MRPKTTAGGPNIGDRLLRAREVASILGLSERFLWTLVREGTLRPVRIGHATRFRASEIRALMESGREEGFGPRLEPGPAPFEHDEPEVQP